MCVRSDDRVDAFVFYVKLTSRFSLFWWKNIDNLFSNFQKMPKKVFTSAQLTRRSLGACIYGWWEYVHVRMVWANSTAIVDWSVNFPSKNRAIAFWLLRFCSILLSLWLRYICWYGDYVCLCLVRVCMCEWCISGGKLSKMPLLHRHQHFHRGKIIYEYHPGSQFIYTIYMRHFSHEMNEHEATVVREMIKNEEIIIRHAIWKFICAQMIGL